MPRLEEEIKEDIVHQLAWDGRVNAAELSVVVHDSIAVLRGSVPSRWARLAAIEDAEAIRGITRVEDHLTVRWPETVCVSDTEIWESVDRILRFNPEIDSTRITVSANEGLVTLDGSVDAYWKKVLAEHLASDVVGVLDVENRLVIVPTVRVTDKTIASDILESYKRNALVDPEDIEVQVSDGVVTLTGTVPNLTAHREATKAAFFTAGVIDVRDNLVTIG